MKMESERRIHNGLRRRAFTLIELLVVVAIILILVGISMKIMQLANRKAGVAKTTWVIEQVKNALAGFYSEYGAYPPVSSISYTWIPDSSIPNRYPDANFNMSTGLVYYLAYFGNHTWSHFITDGGVLGIPGASTNSVPLSNGQGYTPVFTNDAQSINDAWGHEIHYSTSQSDGYQGYKLWSNGPDGINNLGTNDDIGVMVGE